VLKSAGYQVTTAASAEEALSILGKTVDRVDLVISDMIMPGMNGKELAREVFARGFCQHVLFVSGYTEDMVIGQEELASGFELLQKPFSPQELLGKVRDVLNK
jgi:CheY-like chemotaxis protein